MKKIFSRVLWAIFFFACAGVLVASQMGLIPIQIGFWTIAGSIILAICLVYNLANLNITGIVFSIAFLLILYARPLGIQRLSPWTILLAAVLVGIGLNLLLGYKRHSYISVVRNFGDSTKSKVIDGTFSRNAGDTDSHIEINQSMSDVSRYIHSKNLETIDLTSKLSDISLYLDDAQAAGDIVHLNANVMLADVTIYLPLSWQVENNLSPFLSELDIKGTSNGGGPTLVVGGQASISEIEIKYV